MRLTQARDWIDTRIGGISDQTWERGREWAERALLVLDVVTIALWTGFALAVWLFDYEPSQWFVAFAFAFVAWTIFMRRSGDARQKKLDKLTDDLVDKLMEVVIKQDVVIRHQRDVADALRVVVAEEMLAKDQTIAQYESQLADFRKSGGTP